MNWMSIGLLMMLVAACLAHTCIQDLVFDMDAIMAIPQPYTDIYPTTNNTQPIRLRIDTSYLTTDDLGMTCMSVGQVVQALSSPSATTATPYTCVAADVVSTSLKQYLLTLIVDVQQYFQRSLLVMPVQGPLILSSSSNPQRLYGGVNLPRQYTDGVDNLDVVIFVTARPILQDGGPTTTLAVARVVQEDQLGRPIFGHMNINPAGIQLDDAYQQMNLGVLMHESTHALGFNFRKFQLTNAKPGQPKDITKTVTLTVGANDAPSSRTIISSPKVLQWAKQYYACDTVQGVEVENQGGSGTELSHWEKRVTMNEYMTGTASRNPVYSALTLAVLEDTGWYMANYSSTGQMLWGQGMGCDFINRGCNNWPSAQGYFCTEDNAEGCTADFQAKGVCQFTSSSDVPPTYQYFSDPTKIGYHDLPDYCPITSAYETGWCFDPKAVGSSLVDKGESISRDSRCFESSLVKGLALAGPSGPACYRSYCTGPNELQVSISNNWYLCPQGQSIKVVGYGGLLKCPAKIQQMCQNAGVNTSWPIFAGISPNAGGPGLRVTITGKNFADGVRVSIGDPLLEVVAESSTVITATIPNSDTYKSPTNVFEQSESVIITNPNGLSTVGYDKFTIKVKLDKKFLKNAIEYLRDNWLVTAAIVVAIVITCLVCGFCCYRQKGKAEEADTEYYE